MDYDLGNDFNGPEVAQAIRSLVEAEEGKVQQPYICCCTAYEEISFEKRAYEAGMKGFLIKPVNHKQLMQALTQAGLL